MQKSIKFILVILPFVFYPSIFSPYEIPKVWILVVVAICSLLRFLYKSERKAPANPKLLFMIAGLWGWVWISSVASGHFWESWLGNPYRSDGLLTLASLIVLGLTFKMDKNLYRYHGWVGLLLSVLTILTGGESPLLMGNKNFLAGYLAITLPFAIGNNIFTQGLQILALALLGSWGAILTGALFMIFTYLRHYKMTLIVAAVALCLCIFFAYRVEQVARHGEGILNAESRERIWMKAVLAMREKPLLGWGYGQFSRAFATIDWPVHYSADVYVDRPHSSLLDYGVAGGIPAMIAYGYIAVQTSLLLLRDKSTTAKTLGMVVVLYMVQSQTNVTSVVQDWLFFAGVGAAIRANPQTGFDKT